MAKELDPILKIKEEEYNINAIHSEAASEVDHTLTIKKVALDGTSTPVTFNGDKDVTVSVVPSTGGSFTGPIAIKTLSEVNVSEEDKNRLVINYKDILNVIRLLQGYPCFNWDGRELKAIEVADDIALQKVSLVTGTRENYNNFIKQNPKPTFFMYICEDSGEVFFGQDGKNYKQFSVSRLVSTTDYTKAFTYESLRNLVNYIKDLENNVNQLWDNQNTTLNQANNYTTQKVEELSENLEADIGLVKDSLSKIEKDSASISTKVSNNTNAINQINSPLSGILVKAESYTDGRIGYLENTTIQDIQNDLNDSITNIAANTSAINQINSRSSGILYKAESYTDKKILDLKKNYYTCKPTKANEQNAHENSITVSTTIPDDTRGNNGDIWVVYQ